MRFSIIWALSLLVLSCRAMAQAETPVKNVTQADTRAYDDLRIPELSLKHPSRPVVVAVIDDAFNLQHQALEGFVLSRDVEKPNDGVDNDGNGFIDDTRGWDFGDSDPTVAMPSKSGSGHYHGTMVASIVTEIAKRSLGPAAREHIRIMPLKVLPDQAASGDYSLGYEAISYAVNNRADIILCAWSGGKYDRARYHAVFEEAHRRGILILGSAGNFYSEQVDPPASISTVIAVAAVDSTKRKMKRSNYGPKVDLVAPGDLVLAAHPEGNNTYGYLVGSSSAVAMVAGLAAVLKAASPEATPRMIMDALKYTAIPVDGSNTYYGGKLGAGFPDARAALDYLLHPEKRPMFYDPNRTQGEILYSAEHSGPWLIKPEGGYSRVHFTSQGERSSSKATVRFYAGDSLVASYSTDQLPQEFTVRGNRLKVEVNGRLGKRIDMLRYTAVPIDSTRIYCNDIQYIESVSGLITDGSGAHRYAPDCSCKWLITAPAGKRLKLAFEQFDTEPKVDIVHLFAGDLTLPENLLAKFSGPDTPPVIVSADERVLVWFVSDQVNHGQGWQLRYEVTDEASGVYPPIR